jgi:hypothetical protein
MTEARRRIRPHHVEVAPTGLVPDVNSGPADDRDGQWRIICRAEPGFEAGEIRHDERSFKKARNRDTVARSLLMARSPDRARSLMRASAMR